MTDDRTDCCDTWPKPCPYHEGWQDGHDLAALVASEAAPIELLTALDDLDAMTAVARRLRDGWTLCADESHASHDGPAWVGPGYQGPPEPATDDEIAAWEALDGNAARMSLLHTSMKSSWSLAHRRRTMAEKRDRLRARHRSACPWCAAGPFKPVPDGTRVTCPTCARYWVVGGSKRRRGQRRTKKKEQANA